jgi:DNA modification methylase
VKPYYSEDGITIYHGDCREVLPEIDAEVLVTDPPYGMSYCSGWSNSYVRGDDSPVLRNHVLQRWLPKPAIVFGRWSVPRPDATKAVLIWDKGEWPGMGDLSFPWGPSHEEIYVMGDGFCGKRMGTVLRWDRITSNGLHPTEKPHSVMIQLIERCPIGIIVDPFMGSGSTIVAAKQLGRQAIGIEIEEKYCEIAAKRLAQKVLDFK